MSSGLRNSPSVFAIAFFATLAACNGTAEPEPGNATAAVEPRDEPAIKLPDVIPTPNPQLDRAGLLAAVSRAASAHTSGANDSEAQAALAGRRFTLRMRFGCGQAGVAGDGPSAWQYDAAEQRLTIRARPDIDADAAALEGLPEGAVEAVEGFWIPQPWLLADACPAEQGTASGAASPPTVGIAHYFTAQDSRVQRRADRSYEIVRRADPAILPPDQGFNLVLEGRLTPWPGAGVIRCTGSGAAARPVCIVSAEFTRVAFENPETGLTVAQWGAG